MDEEIETTNRRLRRARFRRDAGYNEDGSDPLQIAELNPDGWDDATWRAHTERCSRDALHLRRCQEALRARGQFFAERWALRKRPNMSPRETRMAKHAIRVEAFAEHPRPHPTADGWKPTGAPIPNESLVGVME